MENRNGLDNREIRRRRNLRLKKRRQRQILVRSAAGILALFLVVTLAAAVIRQRNKKKAEDEMAAAASTHSQETASAALTEAAEVAVTEAPPAPQEAPEAEAPAEEPAEEKPEEAPEEEAKAAEEEAAGETEEEEGLPAPENPLLAWSEDAYSFAEGYVPEETDKTVTIEDDSIASEFIVLIDLDDNTIVAGRKWKERMIPASMTKILTLLTAADSLTDLGEKVTIDPETIDYAYATGCSTAGYESGEQTTVKDLLYGTILPSGADAALALAKYCGDSVDGFTDSMNAKAKSLGLSETCHFTNCIGLYNENLYCRPVDMAMILKAAVEIDLCREVLSTKYYEIKTDVHPDGLGISNWFLRRIEDKPTPGTVVCAKTGYVAEAGNCAASYFISEKGGHYICVTGNAYSVWSCIADHAAIYSNYCK